ncbi:MAG: PASTA domain-containing protein [Clostridia bacterium]|nr:PASTA domain-containing protein [Clostridia bacterium]
MLNTDRLCPNCMNDNGGQDICPVCGYDNGIHNDKDKLPEKFWISDRYMVGRAISENNESITYIGWDNTEDTVINIKEYCPSGAVIRNPDKTVSIVSGKEFAFNEGLMEFIDINRKLLYSELPSVVPTVSVFEENGTAYAVMNAIQGITLQDFLGRNGGSLKWEQARPLILPLIDTVLGLHSLGIIHGAISPKTIIVGRDGKLRLTDIGISGIRHSGGEIPTQIYSGYAAPEQYGYEGMQVDFNTDVYGLSAVLFRVLIGAVPPSADERVGGDSLTVPAKFADELPRQVLVSIANGLQLLPQSRTENVEVFKNELVYGETKENIRRAGEDRHREETIKKSGDNENKSSGTKYALISAGVTAGVFLIIAVILCLTLFRGDIFGSKEKNSSDEVSSYDTPSVDSIGDVDPNAVESKILYTVPDLLGKYYSQIVDAEAENEEYEHFEFSIKGKEFSDKYARGTVCAQSVKAGTSVEKKTKVELTISLGTQDVKVANVTGLDEQSAKIELLKQGFLYENIEVVEKYDSEAKPGIVLDQTPKYGEKVNSDIGVRIFVNSYKEDNSGED